MSDQQQQQPVARAMPLVAPIHVLPHPTMTEVALAKVAIGNQTAWALQFATPTGVQIYFVEEAVAMAMAKQIEEQSGSGIVVVPAGGAPPPPPLVK